MSDSFAVYAARRALAVVLVSVTLSALTFVMLHVLTPESFPDPRGLHVELLDYLQGVFLHGDFGDSTQRPGVLAPSELGEEGERRAPGAEQVGLERIVGLLEVGAGARAQVS